MKTREDAIRFCLSLPGAYEDYPFHDFNWTIMRHEENRKMFAAIFEYEGKFRINVKCRPELAVLWRSAYPSVLPAYHMNKQHWNSLVLDGGVPTEELESMIRDSYDLTKKKRKN